MISRKRFNKERLLSGTLLETLILFIFILLAISSIYEKKNRELTNIINDVKILGPGEIAADSLELVQLIALVNKHSDNQIDDIDEIKDVINELDKSKEHYKNKADSVGKILTQGVDPPPCVLSNGNQRLLEIAWEPDYTFVVKVINVEDGEIRLKNNILRKDKVKRYNLKDFRTLGRDLHESKRINIGDPYCTTEVNPKWYSSNYCYECIYVVVIKNSISEAKKKLSLRRILPKKVSMEESNFMTSVAHRYFSLIFAN